MIHIREKKDGNALLATAALTAILVAGTIIIGTDQISLADTADRNNWGIDLRTNTDQAL